MVPINGVGYLFGFIADDFDRIFSNFVFRFVKGALLFSYFKLKLIACLLNYLQMSLYG